LRNKTEINEMMVLGVE